MSLFRINGYEYYDFFKYSISYNTEQEEFAQLPCPQDKIWFVFQLLHGI